MFLRYSFLLMLLAGGSVQVARAQANITGQNDLRIITTAMPFLTISPDARAGALGDAGVATSADVNSIYWNPAKTIFNEDDIGVGISVTPWLRNLGLNDVYLAFLPFYIKLRDEDAITASLTYFSLGNIDLRDEMGQPQGDFTPNELAVSVAYSRKLTESFSVGVGARFIHSNLSGSTQLATGGGATTADIRPANGAAVDLSAYYQTEFALGGTPSQLALGANISNIGPKVSYSGGEDQDFIPTNLRVGFGYTLEMDPYNTITFIGDASKLLVPSPPQRDPNTGAITAGRNPEELNLFQGMFGSFSDAPGGFSEEMQEFILSGGVEYWYDKLFAVRGGYFYENPTKGGRKYFTAGVGLRYQRFGADFAYLIPQQQNNPLANTLRFTLTFNFERANRESVTD